MTTDPETVLTMGMRAMETQRTFTDVICNHVVPDFLKKHGIDASHNELVRFYMMGIAFGEAKTIQEAIGFDDIRLDMMYDNCVKKHREGEAVVSHDIRSALSEAFVREDVRSGITGLVREAYRKMFAPAAKPESGCLVLVGVVGLIASTVAALLSQTV